METDDHILTNERILGVLPDGRISIQRDDADDLEFYSPLGHRYEPAGVKPIVSACTQSGGKILATSPNAEWAVSLEADGLVRWNLFTGNRQDLLPLDTGTCNGAKFSPDSQTLLTSTSDPVLSVRAWRTADWSSQELFGHSVTALNASFSGNSRYLAIAAWGWPPQIFDVESDFREVPVDMVIPLRWLAAALSRTGRWLAVGTDDGMIHIWDVEEGKKVTVLEGHVDGTHSLDFSPDGRTLASTSGKRTILWNVPTWERMFELRGVMNGLGQATGRTYWKFSPDGQYLICPSDKIGARHRLLLAPTSLALVDANRNVGSSQESQPK